MFQKLFKKRATIIRDLATLLVIGRQKRLINKKSLNLSKNLRKKIERSKLRERRFLFVK